jgi:hypothetical protein
VGQWEQFRWGGWVQARSSEQRNKVGNGERGEREGDPGYLAVRDSEEAGYTGTKDPDGGGRRRVRAARGGGKPGDLEVSDVEEPGRPCGVLLREQMRGFHDLLRQNPVSLFMLFGWRSISMAYMMLRSR